MDGQCGRTAVHFLSRPLASMAARKRRSDQSRFRRLHDGSWLCLRRAALEVPRFAAAGPLLQAERLSKCAGMAGLSALAGPHRAFSGRSGGYGPETDSAGMAGRGCRRAAGHAGKADVPPQPCAGPDPRFARRPRQSVSGMEVATTISASLCRIAKPPSGSRTKLRSLWYLVGFETEPGYSEARDRTLPGRNGPGCVLRLFSFPRIRLGRVLGLRAVSGLPAVRSIRAGGGRETDRFPSARVFLRTDRRRDREIAGLRIACPGLAPLRRAAHRPAHLRRLGLRHRAIVRS